jgi:hypothetical protein
LTHCSGTKRTWPLLTASMAFWAMLAAVGAGLVDGHEPLVGEHGLDHLAGAGAARHLQAVLLGLDQQAFGIEVGHDLLAGDEAVQPAVGRGRVVVDLGVERPARRSSAGRGAGPPA